MRHSVPSIRFLAVAALAVAVLGASGCSWFRKGNDLYAQSPESRPLEVPPDLNLPDTAGAMKLPGDATQSVSRSSMAAPAASAAPDNTGFTVQGERDAVFEKIGEVLASTEGVTIASKAQILGTYDIDYDGSQFLLRVTKVQAGAYVSAVDPRGMPASGEAPVKLVSALKAALGAG
jgi:uncharacterized lipoprotein